MNLRLILIAVLVVLTADGCTRRTPSPEVATYYRIELGNQRNVINLNKVFFLGHRVERFRLKFRLFNPGRTDQWVDGVVLTLDSEAAGFQEFRDLPSGADPDGSFWTQEFTNNWTEIRVSSDSRLVDFQGGQPRLEIVAVERHFQPGVNVTDLPAPSTGVRRNVLTLGRGLDVITLSPNLGEAQHYVIEGPAAPQTHSLYISPQLLSLNNSTGLKVHVSTTGFVASDANVSWIEPLPGDSGIYAEFTRASGQDTFVTVVSTVIAPYLISHAWVQERFGNIVMERDAQMTTAPGINLNDIRNAASQDNPFNAQIADYLHDTADFDRRIHESLVIASAAALDASNGQMRFQSAELHRNIRFFRNVDIQFSRCSAPSCRASAGFWRIDMFDEDLVNPVSAATTFHHEWGHWDYGLPDEYLDVSGPPPDALSSEAIDPNSLMGTRGSTEFCYAFNHTWSEDLGGEEESSWNQIRDQYTGVLSAGGPGHGRYLDVLHKLEGLLVLTIR